MLQTKTCSAKPLRPQLASGWGIEEGGRKRKKEQARGKMEEACFSLLLRYCLLCFSLCFRFFVFSLFVRYVFVMVPLFVVIFLLCFAMLKNNERNNENNHAKRKHNEKARTT